MVTLWKALADDSRRQILLLLKKKEMTPSQIAEHFDFTFPAVSTHLRVLKDANLVIEQKEGKNRYYSLNHKKAIEVMKFFEDVWGYKLKTFKEYVERKSRK